MTSKEPGYYERIGRMGGLASAKARNARSPQKDARSAMALGRFDPGPPRDAHQRFCDAWRRSRVVVEINRAAVGSCPD